MNRQLSLNAFNYAAGHHEAAWRHPSNRPERIYETSCCQEISRTAEAETLDAIFFADGPALQGDVAHNAVGRLEPIRGFFRTEYSGRMLRDHFGLRRPGNRFVRPAAVAGA